MVLSVVLPFSEREGRVLESDGAAPPRPSQAPGTSNSGLTATTEIKRSAVFISGGEEEFGGATSCPSVRTSSEGDRAAKGLSVIEGVKALSPGEGGRQRIRGWAGTNSAEGSERFLETLPEARSQREEGGRSSFSETSG